ncbi:hypothetical protein S83_055764 [Arachis hypogaea]
MSVDALGRLCELLKVQGGLSDECCVVPVLDDCIDARWKWFKVNLDCLGALDGTYIDVTIPEEDKSRYRTRKGKISTNVLGVCNRDMNFVYVLSGWEGSASDSRVLRDAISHQDILLEDDHVLIGEEHGGNKDSDDEMIASVEGSNEWTAWRDNLAHEMYIEWMHSRIN